MLAAGVSLHVEIRGSGPPVLLLHGFTGSSRSMRATAESLGPEFRSVCVDLVGHGRSEAPSRPDAYAMERCVAQLDALLDALALPRVHLLGYSMGGRVALSLCAAHPERVSSAVLVGATAGIEAPEQRAARRRSDEALAARIEERGVASFVDDWMRQPLFASQRRLGVAALAAARAQRLENRPHGLAHSLRGMGTGAQASLWGRLSGIRVPICLVVGEEDAKFRAIATALEERLPEARLEAVRDAGHAVHLEQPRAFATLTRRFLAECGQGGTPFPRSPSASAPHP